MGLRDIEATLPPGFRFYPSDEELVCHYLFKKITNEEVLKGTLVEIDLHTCEPWQLPEVAKLNSSEWYFFSFRDRKYATGFRTNRATISGYWKATGKDRMVLDPATRRVVGMRKTLVFYRNRAPNGIKTCWIMHEFRLETPHMPPKEDWVLCRVFHKGKADNNISKVSAHEMMFETTNPAGFSPPIATDLPVPCLYLPQQVPSPHNNCNQNTLLNLAVSTTLGGYHHPHHPFSPNPTDRTSTDLAAAAGFDPKAVDRQEDFSFIWDIGMDESNHHNHPEMGGEVLPPSTVGLRFEEDDNNMIFL